MGYKDLLTLKDLSAKEILDLVSLAGKIKKNPMKYSNKLKGKTLLMIFAKPSLRTHLSFDVGMNELGGHAIFYDLKDSTLGKKESVKDFSKVIDGYADIIMARLYGQEDLESIAKYSEVPVINGLTDDYHPCQILGDLLTMKEKFNNLKKIKVCYVGDSNNNVTHSLIIACAKLGMNLVISGPKKKKFMPNNEIVSGFKFKFEPDVKKAVKNADVIYTDTWMSYQVSKSEKKERERILKKYQVNSAIMNISKKAKFMHCLPAHRGDEVTDEVIDSKRSIVYEQAENRQWSEMAVLLKLMKK
ncbi:MAG: ornithine carbamoyltransferase [Candidatus Pacearchaeota archaeon]|nr:ornithine carbamoyltransferase [Candidatus Pacearchaeota archaeon]